MTREEAIRCLSVHSSTNGSGLCTDEQHYEAKQMAIKALEQEPCEDCISRADAEALFRNARGELHKSVIRNEQNGHPIKDFHTRDLMLLNAEQMIHLLPPVNPQPKTGHWIKISPADIFECSECGQNVMTSDICAYRYCHGCGAKMEESEETE